jgi:ferredoxin
MCPEVFQMNEDGVAEALDLETGLDTAEEAMGSCPMAAIEQK